VSHGHCLPALALAALLAGACGKEAPKADPVTERKEALERAKEGPLGAQVKALEDAKAMEADLNKKATDMIDKAEQGTK
jgi:hypothetical protein